MWSLFSRDPAKDFAYEVGAKVPGLDDKSIWALHEGTHKVRLDQFFDPSLTVLFLCTVY